MLKEILKAIKAPFIPSLKKIRVKKNIEASGVVAIQRMVNQMAEQDFVGRVCGCLLCSCYVV